MEKSKLIQVITCSIALMIISATSYAANSPISQDNSLALHQYRIEEKLPNGKWLMTHVLNPGKQYRFSFLIGNVSGKGPAINYNDINIQITTQVFTCYQSSKYRKLVSNNGHQHKVYSNKLLTRSKRVNLYAYCKWSGAPNFKSPLFRDPRYAGLRPKITISGSEISYVRIYDNPHHLPNTR